jgi:hypothetical protein
MSAKESLFPPPQAPPRASALGRLASLLTRLVSSDRSPHGAYSVPEHLPVGPLLAAQADIWFLFAVYCAATIWPLADPTGPRPLRDVYPGSTLAGLLVTCALLCLTLWSFVLASVTDPGRVPREWPWDPSKTDPSLDRGYVADEHERLMEGQAQSVRGLERKTDGRTRFCKACNVYKPDRTHHCRKLGRCVLEMDHWCAWIRNTVGFRNKKYFFLLITYAWAALFAYCTSLGPYLVHCFEEASALNAFVVAAWILAAAQCVALAVFWGFHVYLAAGAYTTIEFREKRNAGDGKRTKRGVLVKDLYQSSPYDRGLLQNLAHLLGPHLLLWWAPSRLGMPQGSKAGAVYAVKPGHPLARVAAAAANGGGGLGSDQVLAKT